VLARLLTTPDMWQTFAEAYLAALDAAGRTAPKRSRIMYGSFDFDESRYRRQERAKNLAAWHELLLDHFGAGPEDGLLDRLATSPGLAGPELTFLRARIAERRGERIQAAALVSQCLKDLPGHPAYLGFAVEVGAELPPPHTSCYPSAPGSRCRRTTYRHLPRAPRRRRSESLPVRQTRLEDLLRLPPQRGDPIRAAYHTSA
jgi:hypothetical protein